MTDRAHKLLLPGLACLAFTFLADDLLTRAQVWPVIIRVGTQGFLQLNVVWLLSLPFCGAAGAWLAQQGGASVRQRVLVAVLPVITMPALFLITALVQFVLALSFFTPAESARDIFHSIGIFLLGDVAIPGLLLVTGAAPFLHEKPGLPHSENLA